MERIPVCPELLEEHFESVRAVLDAYSNGEIGEEAELTVKKHNELSPDLLKFKSTGLYSARKHHRGPGDRSAHGGGRHSGPGDRSAHGGGRHSGRSRHGGHSDGHSDTHRRRTDGCSQREADSCCHCRHHCECCRCH